MRQAKASADTGSKCPPTLEERISSVPIDRMRNFSIVAHVDHGKSTLSDRLLELTGVIDSNSGKSQVLDRLDVERERGITVKAQTCCMIYKYKDGKDYVLNLVDTPGHVDFRAEVSRSYASCTGALLVVDASQGVQAQTVANFYMAYSMGLSLVPVLNKVDLPHADVDMCTEQVRTLFELDTSNMLQVSAKSGLNVDQVLNAIVERIPAPTGNIDKPFRCLLVDSWFDTYMGVVLLVHVVDGCVVRGARLVSAHTNKQYDVKDLGIMHADRMSTRELRAGQVGYLVLGMKKVRDAHLGDTLVQFGSAAEALDGFEESKPMVFVGAFPAEGANFDHLKESLEHLTLNDRSVSVAPESSTALGQGWRLGFLGTLHASVFRERLEKEYGASLLITAPSVPYKIVYKNGDEKIITAADQFPEPAKLNSLVTEILEPHVNAIISVPQGYVGSVIRLCEMYRGEQLDMTYGSVASPQHTSSTHGPQVVLRYLMPLSQLVNDFFGKLKSVSRGYASLDYDDAGYLASDVVKLELLVNGKSIDALAQVMHRSQIDAKGKEWVTKFRKYLKHQLFEVIIQARAGSRIVARETVKAKRKDVLAKLHAADISRRQKLLNRQKEGKKSMFAAGKVSIPHEAYQGFLSS